MTKTLATHSSRTMQSTSWEDFTSSTEKDDLLDGDTPSIRHSQSSRKWLSVTFMCLGVSLIANIGQGIYTSRLRVAKPFYHSHSGLEFDTIVPFQPRSEYLSHNETLAEELWDAIDIGPMALAISQPLIEEFGLPPSQPFPWDQSKSIYFLRSLHQLHCLKSLRHTVVNLFDKKPTTMPRSHVLHCIDSLRQDIMCYADDSLLPAPTDTIVGQGFEPTCRSWDKLMEWARQREFDSCWNIGDDYRPVLHGLERYKFCDRDSKYYSIMHRYFEIHGHQPMYQEDVH